MTMTIKRISIVCLAVFLWSGCIEPYDPPLRDGEIRHLVVNGFLNASDGTATITLSRTQPVKSTELSPAESGATVYIENEGGAFFPLTENTAGQYSGAVPVNDLDTRYRLAIKTNDNHTYLSDFITLIETPPIDSISYALTSDGVEFQVNTHDATNRARHYRWKFVETYEYHSAFGSYLMFTDTEIVERPPSMAIDVCWKTNASKEIIIGSNKHLKEAVISRAAVTVIPPNSIKLTVKYSLLVEQQAVTEEEYNYWLNLSRSTENLGGLFDPLPSEVTGNIRSTTDPDKKVLGYFGGGTVRELRRTVRRGELPREAVRYLGMYCVQDTILTADLPFVPRTTLLIGEAMGMAGPIGYTTSLAGCIDCRLLGGTTEMPAFWE